MVSRVSFPRRHERAVGLTEADIPACLLNDLRTLTEWDEMEWDTVKDVLQHRAVLSVQVCHRAKDL